MSDEKSVSWMTADGIDVIPGAWYLSKRNHIAQAIELLESGGIMVLVHTTGNKVEVWPEQIQHFRKTKEPNTPAGTFMLECDENETVNNTKEIQIQDQYSHVYRKYSRVIHGSVYKVKNVTNRRNEPFVRGKKTTIKGQVRCKINCEICGSERDIKVQDAFQVKLCLECKNKKRKKNLKKFLDKKENNK
ncbi:hypothetical protein KAR91_70920 [Candidatus Pacearchaeota archaeon]|nr:hypothetical protein [Candidatus Pacearchaeota archaeon]